MAGWPPSQDPDDGGQPPPPPPERPPQYPPPPPPQYPPQYGYQQPYPPYPPAGYQSGSSYNGFAIASLVLGIMWIYWIGSILALVFGFIAKKQIRERGQQGAGLATAGVVLGFIGMGTLLLTIIVLIVVSSTSGST